MERVSLRNIVLEETEVAESVKVKLWELVLLERESIASDLDARVNYLVQQVSFVDDVLSMSYDFVASVVVVVVTEIWVLIQWRHIGLILWPLLLRLIW